MTFSKRLMTSADISRLPLKQIETALRKTTEVLAAELAAPTQTTPDWTDFEWRIAQAAAAMHGVSPLLSGTLRWRGPASWESFLGEQREHTFQRHQRIARLLAEIGARAVRDGIAIVPLKGAALHELGIYQPGERPMSDIDLLVKSADLEATARLLGACGYRESYVTWKHRVFEADATTDVTGFGEHADNPVKIELHGKVAERMPVFERDISNLVFPIRPHAGLNSYPSTAALMVHLLLHSAGAMCSNTARLLHLHDIALLSRRMTGDDWEQLFAATNDRTPWWTSPPLALTARYYSGAIPAHVLARADSDCSWLLRRISRRRMLCDVSLSSLWIQAFPGIEWSHSAQEATRYIASRIGPPREMIVARTNVARMHPSAAHFWWPHLPQWQRLLCWVFRRPPRIEILSSVNAALAHPGTHPQLTPHP